jgi:hypothetical protein
MEKDDGLHGEMERAFKDPSRDPSYASEPKDLTPAERNRIIEAHSKLPGGDIICVLVRKALEPGERPQDRQRTGSMWDHQRDLYYWRYGSSDGYFEAARHNRTEQPQLQVFRDKLLVKLGHGTYSVPSPEAD